MLRWCILLCLCALGRPVGTVDVVTEYGPIQGRTIQVNNGRQTTTVDEFRGIPFAKDTSGARRFMNPEAPDPWTEVFEAFTAGDACPQTGDTHSMSENCLHVDIYTPDALSSPGTYPVMVWIHGGGYQTGANVNFPGHFLATHGIIVAVLNYRLGKFGYQYTGNDACPGNVGLWDQLMGLEFVINNIANFGGDPAHVTLAGQSAGATSTGIHMVSPQSKDLFQQALLESGAETNIWAVNPPESQPEQYTRKVAEDLGCLRADDYQMMDCLRAQSVEDILRNSSLRCSEGYICLGMAPVVDGENGFLPNMPDELRDSGNIMLGPIMAGIAQDDGATFTPIFAPGTLVGCCNRSRWEVVLDRLIDFASSRMDEEAQEELWHAMDWNYVQWPYMYDNDHNRDGLVRFITDGGFGVAWDRQIKAHQALADTYGYIFDYRSDNETLPEWMGVTHSMEHAYVWGFPMLEFNEHIANDSHRAIEEYTAEDLQYSLFIQELWTNFVKYGDPTFLDVQQPSGNSTVWPKFDTETYNVIYLSNDLNEPVVDYRQQDYAFWTDYLNYLVFNIESGEEGGGRAVDRHVATGGVARIREEQVTALLGMFDNGFSVHTREEIESFLEEFVDEYLY